MKILMINYEFPPFGGGTGVACSQLLSVFATAGDVSIDLVTSGCNRVVERHPLTERITLHRLPIPKRDLRYWRADELARWTAHALFYARRLAAVRDYHLCHCWGGWPSGVIGYALRGWMPYLISLRGSDVPGYNSRLRWMDPLLMRHVSRRIWRHAARVVAVSRELRRLALISAPATTIDVIPNGVDFESFRQATVGNCNLLFVGRLIERKGAHLAIEAFSRLADEHPALILTVVGDGPERSALEALASQTGARGRIRFLGHLDRARLVDAYAAAGIFVLPASSDAMPNVVLEAMASGLAIVTSRTGAMEVLAGNGIVIDHGDVGRLRDAIAGYIASPALLADHQRRSRQIVESRSWSKVADYFALVYAEVANARGGSVASPAREFIPLSS